MTLELDWQRGHSEVTVDQYVYAPSPDEVLKIVNQKNLKLITMYRKLMGTPGNYYDVWVGECVQILPKVTL